METRGISRYRMSQPPALESAHQEVGLGLEVGIKDGHVLVLGQKLQTLQAWGLSE